MALVALHSPAAATEAAGIEEIRAQIVAIQAENERKIEQMRAETAAQVARLTAALDQLTGTSPSSAAPVPVVTASVARPAVSAPASRLQLSGDARLRYELNTSDDERRDRGREVFRLRLRGNYALNARLSLGARLVTGDPDDPNSADVTLSQFADDLQVSLDQAFLRARFGALDFVGGKFDNPFVRTDLVWDGDVSPQGLAATYTLALSGGVKVRTSGLYFAVDEAAAARDSSMIGGQLAATVAVGPTWSLEAAAGYYDYRLHSLSGADAGDFRSNLLRLGGGYQSDFNLVDLVASATYLGFGPKWPVRLTGDYVRNLGAEKHTDEGFAVDLFVGRASARGDWRFQYGYAEAEVDAVLAAFSQDNTDIATNYLQHTLAIDFVPVRDVVLNATFYRYRPKDPRFAGAREPGDWLSRFRLNLTYGF